jgi:glutathione S-transferase
MPITLYDLAGRDPDLRFSPYCWRTRMALAHKDLSVETVPWRFSEKSALRFSGQKQGQEKVPVIDHDGKAVFDSWAIACYLDDRYPDRPGLFGDQTGRAHAHFINAWADTVMLPAIARLIVRDVWQTLHPKDQDYFRKSREKRLGGTLESVQEGRETRVDAFRTLMQPVRTVLTVQEWLGGDAPTYADYIVFGNLQWARCTSRFELLEDDDPVAEWRGRVLDLFDGLAAEAPVA